MKKNIKSFVSLLLVILCIVSLYSCKKTESPETPAASTAASTVTSTEEKTTADAQLPEIWKDAVYTENKEFGNGAKKILLEVTAGEKTVTFTINTDKNTVGEALTEYNLIDGEDSEYGLYIKTVNGILADYSIDQSYWSFYVGENLAATGVDSAEISAGTTYKLIYTK